MKATHILLLCGFSLSLFAQDFPSDVTTEGENSFTDDSFGDDSFGEDSFGGLFGGEESALEISGTIDIPMELDLNSKNPEDSQWIPFPLVSTDLDYATDKADLHIGFETLWETGKELSLDLDEAYARIYLGHHDLEAGLRKITWGKGDKVHVMDVLNPMDYSHFIEPEYNDRKQADLMVRLNLSTGNHGRLELVYLPWFTPDTYPTKGSWVQSETQELLDAGEEFLTTYSENYYSAVYPTLGSDAGLAALATAQRLADAEENFVRDENTQNLEHAQGGFRFTHTLGALDWGLAGVRSYLRDPIVTLVDMNAAALSSPLTAAPHVSTSYTPMWLIAIEAGLVADGFNFRGEGALSLTEDWDGSDEDLKNPRVEWLFGFDRDLPIHKLNFNIQGKGQYILLSDAMEKDDPEEDDRVHSHMLFLTLSDNFLYEALELTLGGNWNMEDQDYYLTFQADYTFKESITFGLGYRIYEGENDTLFGQFDNQDRLVLSIEMQY